MLIPVQRKFNKPTKTGFGNRRPFHKPSFSKPPISLRFLWIIFGVFALFYGVFLLFKYTLFVPEYTIATIDYSLSNVQTYDDPYFYKMISTAIKWENYRVAQWNESSILKQLQVNYPFVQSFSITYKWPNRVFVKVSFEEPKLIVFQWNLRYAVYKNNFFQLFSWNRLGSGALRVELFPSLEPIPVVSTGILLSGGAFSGSGLSGVHLSGAGLSWSVVSGIKLPPKSSLTGSLTGLFYQEPFDHFMSNLQTIYEAFPNAKYFKYLVGGQRIVVWLPNDRTVYINLRVDLSLQLQNYLYLKQYYAEFSKLKEIDLGSIEMDKVIVRK